MTVPSAVQRITFAGNGVTTIFSFPHLFLADEDLTVILTVDSTGVETEQVITTNYTVSGAGEDAGGNVTMIVAPATGETLTILRDPAITQGLDLVENDDGPAESMEEAWDRLTMIAQRLNDLLERSVKVSDGFTDTFDFTLPSGLAVADITLATNAAGDGWAIGPTITDIADAETNATAAAASATAAAASAAAAAVDAATLAAAFYQDVIYIDNTDSPVTIVQGDNGFLYVADTSGGAITINLPTISGLSLPFNFSTKLQTSGNNLTINRGGSDTIDGETSKIISEPGDGFHFIADTDLTPDQWTSIQFGNFEDSPLVLKNAGFKVEVAAGAATITHTQSDGSTAPTEAKPYVVGIDNLDGTYSILKATSTFNSVIPSGATLGQDTTESPVYIYVLNNGGVLKSAISSALKDETVLHTTVAFSSGSDIDDLYSDAIYSNVSIKLVGMWLSTQGTPGTWAAATGNKITNPENVKTLKYEKIEINMGFSGYTVTADVFVDTIEEHDVPVGVFEIGYDLSLQHEQVAGASGRGLVSLRQGSNVIANTTSISARNNALLNDVYVFPHSRYTTVTVSTVTTYKLSVKNSAADTVTKSRIVGEDITGALTNPDNASIFWIRRIS